MRNQTPSYLTPLLREYWSWDRSTRITESHADTLFLVRFILTYKIIFNLWPNNKKIIRVSLQCQYQVFYEEEIVCDQFHEPQIMLDRSIGTFEKWPKMLNFLSKRQTKMRITKTWMILRVINCHLNFSFTS